MKKEKGSALSGALVAIVAVGLLSGLVYFVLSIVKKQGMDARRVTDIKYIQKSLELFYDQNANYPAYLDELISSGIMSSVPIPPPGSSQKVYSYVPLGDNRICTGYHLGAVLETNYQNYLSKDADSFPRTACAGAFSEDFDGTAPSCLPGEMGVGAVKDRCFDVEI